MELNVGPFRKSWERDNEAYPSALGPAYNEFY